MKFFQVLCIIFLLGIITVSCSQSNQTSGKSGKSKEPNENVSDIYTSLYPIQYITERIGGDTVSVKTVYRGRMLIHMSLLQKK